MANQTNTPYHSPRHWTLAQTLENRTDRSGGADACWPWLRHVNRKRLGYGRFEKDGTNLLAHRVAWEIANGTKVPANMRVLHRCDNSVCCNPSHLFLGTQADNVADMFAKSRATRTPSFGADNGAAKLTEADILAIRADPRRQRIIAAAYGLTHGYVSRIKRYDTWKHLTTARKD